MPFPGDGLSTQDAGPPGPGKEVVLIMILMVRRREEYRGMWVQYLGL